MRIGLGIACWLSATLAGAAEVSMPGGQPFPDKPQRNEKGGDRIAWVAHDGYKLRKLPSATADASGHTCRFMEPLIWLTAHQAGGEFYLLGKQTGIGKYEPLGWIESYRCCCVTSTYCLKDESTGIFRKAYLVNKPDALREAINTKSNLGVVPIHLRPECKPDDPQTAPLTLSTLLFIYADHPAINGGERHYLVGVEPEFVLERGLTEPTYAGNVVLGWVPESRVFAWETREALEFNRANTLPNAPERRTVPAKAYATEEQAKAAAEGKVVEALFEEQFDDNHVSQAVSHAQMRFPLTPIGRGAEEGNYRTVAGGRLYKVGFSGPLVSRTDGKTVLLERDRVSAIQQQMNEIRETLATTEILFVIDGTESMEKGFEKAAQAIEKILKTAKARPDLKVNLGVAIYKDNDSNKPIKSDVEVWELADAASPKAAQYLEKLKGFSKPGSLSGGGGPLEQVFYGLEGGLDDTTFRKFSRKMVVAIGDMGDHKEDKDGSEARKIVERLIPASKAESPKEFYALQVVDPHLSDDSRRYRDQMQRICKTYDAARGKRPDDTPPEARVYTLADEDRFLKHIQDRYEQLSKRSDELAEDLKRVQLGRFSQIKSGGMMRTILSDQNVPFDRLQEGVQVFTEGYVFEEHAGKRQIRLKYLMSDTDVRDISEGISGTLDRVRRDVERRGAVGGLNQILLDNITGDRGTKQPADGKDTVGERISKLRGLAYRSPLLNRTFAELRNSPNAGGVEGLQELEDIRKRKRALELAIKNQRPIWVTQEKKIGEVLRINEWVLKGDPIPEERRFKLDGARSNLYEWIWLDCEDEMP